MGVVYNSDYGRTKDCVFEIDFGLPYSYNGTTVQDTKNSGIACTINGAPAFSTDHLVLGDGKSITTPGLATNSPVSFASNFSIQAIFRPTVYQPSTNFGLTNMLIQKGPASTYNYAAQVTNDTTVSFVKRTSPEGLIFSNFTVPSLLNKINVLLFVVTTTNILCYLNGNFIASNTISGAAITPVANDVLEFGDNSTGTMAFIGGFYSARIYNSALSQNDALGNYLYAKRRYGL